MLLYITLKHVTLHVLHHTALHTLHTLRYVTLQYLQYITFHCIPLHSITFHYITFHYITVFACIYVNSDGLKLRMPRSFPIFFLPRRKTWPISGGFGSNWERLFMILLYLGRVVLSFSPSTPKLVNFHHFLDSKSWEKNMSTPKLVSFPNFLDSRSWEKTCQHQN